MGEGGARAGAPLSGPVDPAAWVPICPQGAIDLDRGVAAMVDGRQVAIFRIAGPGGAEEWCALDNHDPFSDANVLARGIVGSAGERAYVASPMHKQRFDLRTGGCLDDDGVSVGVWPVLAVDGWVHVRPRPA